MNSTLASMILTQTPVKRSSRRAGFSLAEVLVALTILGLASTAILGSLVFVHKSVYDLDIQTSLNSRTDFAMEQMGIDLRSTVDVKLAKKRKLQIKVRDSLGNEETVTYQFFRKAKELTRKDGSGNTRYLFLNLDDFKFEYHTSKNEPTTNLLDIKKVTASLSQNQQILNRSRSVEFFSARYLLRNRLGQ